MLLCYLHATQRTSDLQQALVGFSFPFYQFLMHILSEGKYPVRLYKATITLSLSIVMLDSYLNWIVLLLLSLLGYYLMHISLLVYHMEQHRSIRTSHRACQTSTIIRMSFKSLPLHFLHFCFK